MSDAPSKEDLKQGYERLEPLGKDGSNNVAQLLGKKVPIQTRPLPKQSD